ncbi:MAG: SurA N-terminal domain-containing protein [Proteobacteria bacterium]|nr:SurA N-terminal domain-containing protein [Pseudomonadota bacterium]
MDNRSERIKKIAVKIILTAVTVPFVLFGINSYFEGQSHVGVVAKINGHDITQSQFLDALTQQKNQIRAEMGPDVDSRLLNSISLQKEVLNHLIDTRVLMDAARNLKLVLSSNQINQIIASIPEFQDKGKFSQAKLDAFLSDRQLTLEGFKNLLDEDFVMNRMQKDITQSNFVAQPVANMLIDELRQQRVINIAQLPVKDFVNQVKVSDAEVQTWYKTHQKDFLQPEAVKLQYVVLSKNNIASGIHVGEDEAKSYYKNHIQAYTLPEERRVRHILVALPHNPTPAQVAAAKAKAKAIYTELTAHPDRFAEIAIKESQDPGSASKGGDLGYISKGTMVKAFDAAAFSLPLDKISKPVQTQFGFHIIEVTAIKPASVESFNQVKSKVIDTIRNEQAKDRFDDLAEKFTNVAYEQSTTLTPAAKIANQEPLTTDWVSKDGENSNPLLNNKRFLKSIFVPDVLKDKRNSQAVEVAPKTLITARMIAYRPAGVIPLAQVASKLKQNLVNLKAHELAKIAAKKTISLLQTGNNKVHVPFGAAITVSRQNHAAVPQSVVSAAYKLSSHSLPAYATVNLSDGSIDLVRLTAVTKPPSLDQKTQEHLTNEISGLLGHTEFSAYMSALKKQDKIIILKKSLN